METLQPAPRGAEGAARGRQQMDRHRRHLAVRRLRLQSRRRAHRPERKPPSPRDQGVGQARVQEPRRRVELGTRNIKVALRRLRSFARDGRRRRTRSGTAPSAAPPSKGYLDIHMLPERHNTIKVLMFFDVGGSMDWHIKGAEELFSAARSEFKHLEYYYFHNCLYESVWKDNRRRARETTPTWDVLHTYPPDYKVIFVGDAAMSPYEITHIGGAVEHMNDEAGRPVAAAA